VKQPARRAFRTALTHFRGVFAQAAPRRGQAGTANDGNLIFGPLEAGFTVDQITRLFATAGPCATPGFSAPGGLDTLIAEEAIEYACGFNTSILDACGGHAKNPCT
jgi:hypothetical protein